MTRLARDWPHDDGISLEEFVDWLVAAGHPIERIDEYDEWLTRFETTLRAQPERRRQHSPLPCPRLPPPGHAHLR